MITALAPRPETVAVRHADQPPLLVGVGLRKRFGQTEALRGIDFSLAPGEIVAVMGPSGSPWSCHRTQSRWRSSPTATRPRTAREPSANSTVASG